MKCNRILWVVLLIFIVGMIVGVSDVSASHTFKAGKYKGKISNKQYKSLKVAKKKGKSKSITVKTGKYKTITKKVKKKFYKYCGTVQEWYYWDNFYHDNVYTCEDNFDGTYDVYEPYYKTVKVSKRYPVKMNVQVYRGGAFVKFYLGGFGEILASRNVRI